MKKIGIVTIISMNLGNRLQNYALQKSIEKLGYECKTIPTDNDTNYLIKIIIKKILKSLVPRFRNVSWDQFNKGINWERDKSAKLTEKDLTSYHKFVAGSDQIWNPLFEMNSGREFLDFANKKQKTAYAASIGLTYLPEKYMKQYKEWLKDFQFISMRENEGARIIKQLIGRDVPVVLDPTMLLSREEWSQVAEKSRFKPHKKYIAKYVLGIKNVDYDRYVLDRAKELNADIIDISDYNEKNHDSLGPHEFIYLIKNAECIYTDSFHGTVFSIIFHKSFIVFDRLEQQGYGAMSSRLNTLLQKFALLDYRVYSIEDLKNERQAIDYSRVDIILEAERKTSIHYLETTLI